MHDKPVVLVVDDDPAVLASVDALLGAHGLPVLCFASAEEFEANYHDNRPGCLVTDLRLPGISGLELFDKLTAAGSPLLVVLVTGTTDVAAGTAPSESNLVVLEKPYTSQDLVRVVRQSLQLSQQRWQLRQAAMNSRSS